MTSGIGPAGHAYVGRPLDPLAKAPPLALHFDPSTKDAVMLDDGRMQADHPVDAWMDLALSVPKGSLKSSPTVGHTFLEIEYLDGKLEANFASRVAAAVQSRVSAGDVRIDRAQVERITGGYVGIITYTNLRTLTQKPRQIRTNIG